MMRQLWSVLRKEVVDNLRDRRTLLTVLVFGPLFGPVFYTVMMNAIVNQQISNRDKPLKLPVAGAQYAPGLVEYLKQHDTEIEAAPGDPRAAVTTGRQDVVLVIGKDYATAFSAGKPATLQLIEDASRQSATKNVRRARDLLDAYAREISSLRLLARGTNPGGILSPLAIEKVDVSTPRSRAVLVLGFLPYFFLFATIMGGFYLAIDATAGERERGSLEPLLTTAISRTALVAAKLVAVTAFCALSLALAVVAFYACQGFIHISQLDIAVNFDIPTALNMFLIGVPFTVFIAALLTVVASFTRSYKEAQTWLSFVFVLPMIPAFGLMLSPAQPSLWMMAIPTMSQNVLMTSLLKGELLKPLFVATSVGSTLLLGLLLSWLAVWLYRQERILG
ncbi:MAG TPA: ABC transporter permease [Gammaproteobacteria bacterium]